MAGPHAYHSAFCSALAMDKTRAKAAFAAAGAVVESLIAPKSEVMARHVMDTYVVAERRVSVGVYIVSRRQYPPGSAEMRGDGGSHAGGN